MNLVLIITVLLGIILFIILFSKLKIKIYKRGSGKLELDIYFLFFAHINLNLTRIFDKYLKTHSTKENINTILSNIRLFINNNKIIEKILNKVTVKKIYFITGYNTSNPLFYPYLTVLNWSIVSSVKNFVDRYFKKVDNEYYQVMMNDESKKGINIDALFSVRVISILIVILIRLKEFIKLIKYIRKGKEENGRKLSTNQSIIKNSDGLA